MANAWKLIILAAVWGANAQAEENGTGPIVAMDALKAKSYRAGEIVTVGGESVLLIGRSNLRVELSPHSVGEFDEKGALRLMRGSAVVESRQESAVRTPGARIEFVGRTIVSYDHQEKSSSIFVLEGEARVVNAHREDTSLRLQRFRGATIVVGDVLPQLVRQLDVGSVADWLKGFAWSEARRQSFLKNMPGESIVTKAETPSHLEDVKIEDYFSSIETADEQHQPNYYDKKFDDQDNVVADQNSKPGVGKMLSPEEAALMSLPKTQIDLGFDLGPEFISIEQKTNEVAKIEPPKTALQRGIASLADPKPTAAKPKAKAGKVQQAGDPEINLVLQRLRQVKSGNTVFTQVPALSHREKCNWILVTLENRPILTRN